jgi:outer membrane protein assembly factor BamE (lipoprotein component of BamABCDE complex)
MAPWRTHVRHDLRRAEVLAFACLLLAVLAGCVTPTEDRDARIFRLRMGMSREQVRAVMGAPRVVETIGQVEFWLYRVENHEQATQDISDSERDVGTVGFVNGRVTGWGEAYYNDAIKGIITADDSTAREKN